MSNKGLAISLAVTVALHYPILSRADQVEDVQNKIIAAAKKVKSMKADMTTEMDMPGMSQSAKGTMEFMWKGDKYLSRMEMTSKMKMSNMTMDSKILTVVDGEYSYMLSEQMGQKTAIKSKLDPKMMSVVSESMFDAMRDNYTLKVLPDETVDGRSTYVIESTPKSGNDSLGKMIQYFDKELGMALKTVVYDAEGSSPMSTTHVTNVKTNVDLSAERFVFKAPEGVQIIDTTNQ